MICGIDEAGRGPLAGPVYAAAVVLPDGFPAAILDDSKKLSEKKRDAAAAVIQEAAAYGIGFATHTEIDEINILQASLLAMRRAFLAMCAAFPDVPPHISEAVVDGLFTPDIETSGAHFSLRPMVKADAAVPAVMAASILAKTARDAEMRRLSVLYPVYQFEKHKGYPTALHRQKIREHGPSPVHRRSFRLDNTDERIHRLSAAALNNGLKGSGSECP
ncbi:MAG: ribonuclease HII [Spirochaetaceae bacterium]|jgi:ribonuclease HII|nr:ribonuclease HII [Spirochaetaceae bacterium]